VQNKRVKKVIKNLIKIVRDDVFVTPENPCEMRKSHATKTSSLDRHKKYIKCNNSNTFGGVYYYIKNFRFLSIGL